MSAATLDALYAHVSPDPVPVVSLAELDRRRDGEDFPTIPVGGLELDVNDAAAALFESGAEELAVPRPDTDTLYEVLKTAVTGVDRFELVKNAEVFAGLPDAEFSEVRQCREFAYQLAVSFWYRGARSRLMTRREAAVCLYLSDLGRYRRADFMALPRHRLVLSRALHQGAAMVPTETLIRLGKAFRGQFDGKPDETDWLAKQVLPDYHRRRFCLNILEIEARQPAPLIVRLDSGGYVLGLTPPAGPSMTRRAWW